MHEAKSEQLVPLMTQVYQDNYPAESRGKLYARTFSLRIVGAMLFAWGGGRFLDAWPDRHAVLLLVFAARAEHLARVIEPALASGQARGAHRSSGSGPGNRRPAAS